MLHDNMVEIQGIEPMIHCLQNSGPAIERDPQSWSTREDSNLHASVS